jgi:hypothetical protein
MTVIAAFLDLAGGHHAAGPAVPLAGHQSDKAFRCQFVQHLVGVLVGRAGGVRQLAQRRRRVEHRQHHQRPPLLRRHLRHRPV